MGNTEEQKKKENTHTEPVEDQVMGILKRMDTLGYTPAEIIALLAHHLTQTPTHPPHTDRETADIQRRIATDNRTTTKKKKR